MSKLEGTFSISEAFKYSTLARVFYIIYIMRIFEGVLHYIDQEDLWLEQKRVNRDNFSPGG